LLDSSHLTMGNIGGEVRWLLSNKPKQTRIINENSDLHPNVRRQRYRLPGPLHPPHLHHQRPHPGGG
jgi:hypothetical protein